MLWTIWKPISIPQPRTTMPLCLPCFISKAVEISGASSVDEFAEQILSKEAERIINQAGKGDVSQQEIDDIANKLKGLGYLE